MSEKKKSTAQIESNTNKPLDSIIGIFCCPCCNEKLTLEFFNNQGLLELEKIEVPIKPEEVVNVAIGFSLQPFYGYVKGRKRIEEVKKLTQ